MTQKRYGRRLVTFVASVIGGLLLSTNWVSAQTNIPPTETPELRAKRTQWWREAKFGMFIHWGVYCVPAGVWNGKDAGNYSEWVMWKAKIPLTEYQQLAGQFNPVKFNADQWVKTAKAAGMKYIVITAKHHDGFAMYDSKASSYDIADATPFKRDPLKELAEACRREGLKFGVYYSVDRDWQHPDALCMNKGEGNTWDYPDDSKKDFARYLQEKAMPQLKEILTSFGPVSILWFDDVGTKTPAQNEAIIKMVRQFQPDCLINSRLGDWKTWVWGDYRSMGDNRVPEELLAGGWENPGTMNRSYGYKSTDHNWKTPTQVIQMLVDIASKGGNYLLNVGPMANGEFPPEAVNILDGVGKWMDKHSESIYGVAASPFGSRPWGRCTTKPGRLFLHIFNWPEDDHLIVPPVGGHIPSKAYLLADPEKRPLKTTVQDNGELIIEVDRKDQPAGILDPSDTVVVLLTQDEPR